MPYETAIVTEHSIRGGGYRMLALSAPAIAATAKPGQFLHLRVPCCEQSVLRRPFSIYRAADTRVAVLYKVVGGGTAALSRVLPGDPISVIGPLGNGFPLALPPRAEVGLVAGGYGVAPLSLLASRLPATGALFVGARTAGDILCVEDFETLGWTVHVTTEDGSCGTKGLVTDPLDLWLAARTAARTILYACGPTGLMRALASRATQGGYQTWLSLDTHMGCGVGACLTCVQRVTSASGKTAWKRVCKDGPVFDAAELVWEGEE